MTTARCILCIFAFAIGSALAAPVPPGAPFEVRLGKSVELAQGVKLKFVGVSSDGRCPSDVSCVWQGEATIEIELQAPGHTAREALTTESRERTLLAHRVQLLGLYPSPRDSEKRPANEYVAFFRVASAAPAPAFANRAAALAAAVRYVDAYASAAQRVCADWQQRRLASYVEDGGGLCEMISRVSRTAHAVSEDAGGWNFFFAIDNPQLRQQMNEAVYLLVTASKASKDALDRVSDSNVVALPREATLL